MAGEPLHKVESKLIIVDTEAAVALASGTVAVAFVVDEALPDVVCVPAATAGPAALERRLSNSFTNPVTTRMIVFVRLLRHRLSYRAAPKAPDPLPSS